MTKLYQGWQHAEAATTLPTSANVKSPELIEHPVAIGYRAEIHDGSSVGAFSFINIDTVIYRNTEIGRFCSFARSCEIGAAGHPTTMLSSHSFQYSAWMFPKLPEYKFQRKTKYLAHPKTIIGHDVWVGAQSVVLAGVKIGHGAVIAANSVVTKDVPPYAIVGGTPAKIIRYRFSDDVIERLLKAEWWDLPFEQITKLPFDDIDACLTALGAPQKRDRPLPIVRRTWKKIIAAVFMT